MFRIFSHKTLDFSLFIGILINLFGRHLQKGWVTQIFAKPAECKRKIAARANALIHNNPERYAALIGDFAAAAVCHLAQIAHCNKHACGAEFVAVVVNVVCAY